MFTAQSCGIYLRISLQAALLGWLDFVKCVHRINAHYKAISVPLKAFGLLHECVG